MTTDRLDIGPHRWIAAGGQAFLYVRVKAGRELAVAVAPVRDVVSETSVVIEKPGQELLSMFSLLLGLPALIGFIYKGAFDHFWGWITLAGLVVMLLLILMSYYRRIGRPVILYGFGTFAGPRRIDFTTKQVQTPEFVEFLERLEDLSRQASNKPRTPREYSLNAWWMTLVFVAGAIGLFTVLVPHFFAQADPYLSLAIALFIASVAVLFSSERNLLLHPELRTAHALLLDYEPDAAIKTLQAFLQRKPNHPYATKLMTVAELLRGNMDVAEAIVVEGDVLAPVRTPGPVTFIDFKDWES